MFGQVGLAALGLKSRLVFARAVCWPWIHVPQAWIGCWTGLLNLESIGVAFGPSSFTDLDFADDVSLLAEMFLFPYWRQWQVRQHPRA